MITIRLDVSALVRAGRELKALRRLFVETVAAKAVDLSATDYQTKAEGGTGLDGVKWAPITEEAKRSRVRRARGRSLSDEYVRASDQRDRLRDARKVLPNVPKGKAGKAARDRLRAELSSQLGQEFSGRLTQKRLSEMARERRQAMKAESPVPNADLIGVDTGDQRAAVSTSNAPGSLYEVRETGNVTRITVGTGIDYSSHFDRVRSIFLDEAPDAWIGELETAVQERLDQMEIVV